LLDDYKKEQMRALFVLEYGGPHEKYVKCNIDTPEETLRELNESLFRQLMRVKSPEYAREYARINAVHAAKVQA
jgi:hypothetical protein